MFQTHKIPSELVVNLDQTRISLPASEWTLVEKGCSHVEIASCGDKHQGDKHQMRPVRREGDWRFRSSPLSCVNTMPPLSTNYCTINLRSLGTLSYHHGIEKEKATAKSRENVTVRRWYDTVLSSCQHSLTMQLVIM